MRRDDARMKEMLEWLMRSVRALEQRFDRLEDKRLT